MSTSTRPGEGFRPYDEAPAVAVEPDGEVLLLNGNIVAHRLDADKVLCGGGLPDEAVDLKFGPQIGRTEFSRSDGIDVCVKHDGGETVVWLAP